MLQLVSEICLDGPAEGPIASQCPRALRPCRPSPAPLTAARRRAGGPQGRPVVATHRLWRAAPPDPRQPLERGLGLAAERAAMPSFVDGHRIGHDPVLLGTVRAHAWTG